MEVLTEAPKFSSFTPLAEHQSVTPASFYSGPPVLHYYSDRCKILVLDNELSGVPALSDLVRKVGVRTTTNEAEHTNGDTSGDQGGQNVLEDIDLWVTSDKLLIYSKPHETGLSIPYPTISLHAIQSLPVPSTTEPQSQGLYMQLIPFSPSTSDDDEPPDTVSVTIIPTASSASAASTRDEDDPEAAEDRPAQTPVMSLFTALSNCSNLHPDPTDPDEAEEGGESRILQAGLAIPGTSDGSLPPPMPGSGGWITAENMHEYFDEQGNWIGGDDEETTEPADAGTSELGPGAGTVRTREEDGTNGNGHQDPTKWQRTS